MITAILYPKPLLVTSGAIAVSAASRRSEGRHLLTPTP